MEQRAQYGRQRYRLVTASDPETLERQVNDLLAEGWELAPGRVTMLGNLLARELIRPWLSSHWAQVTAAVEREVYREVV